MEQIHEQSYVSFCQKKGFEEAKPVIAALKEMGMSSVGAAGYCWGGKYHLLFVLCFS